MSKKLIRYSNLTIVEHIASQYVLGTLSDRVRRRTEQLIVRNSLLDARINYWQQSFIDLDKKTVELAPKECTWHNISAQMDSLTQTEINDALDQNIVNMLLLKKKKGLTLRTVFTLINGWFSVPNHRLIHLGSLAVICLLSLVLLNSNEKQPNTGSLSYIAVLTGENKQAQLVASTYGESKKLVVNIINAPKVTTEEDLELWVVSKVDHEARSLGIIPRNIEFFEQQLSEAQWRLIKDSESLIVTIEDLGGSSIGEPSATIVSRGLCVRLKEWNKDA